MNRTSLGAVALTLCVATLASAAPAGAQPQPAAQPPAASQPLPAAQARIKPLPDTVKVRVAFSPVNFFPLPVLYAVAKGYFAHANLDIEIVKYMQAAVSLAPLLARGDIDIAPQTPSPSLFNLALQGFGAKTVSVYQDPKPGRAESVWLMVAKEKANEIKEPADLRGKVVEISQSGSTTNFLMLLTLKEAGLTPGKDVTTRAANHGTDYLPLVMNKAQDVIGVTEPTATSLAMQGYVVRWKSVSDIALWFQSVVMMSSEKFLEANRPALVTFLEVYVATIREINARNGVWNDELMHTITAWSNVSPEVVRAMGGVPYVNDDAKVSRASLERSEDFWIAAGSLSKRVPYDEFVDTTPLTDALAAVDGKR